MKARRFWDSSAGAAVAVLLLAFVPSIVFLLFVLLRDLLG